MVPTSSTLMDQLFVVHQDGGTSVELPLQGQHFMESTVNDRTGEGNNDPGTSLGEPLEFTITTFVTQPGLRHVRVPFFWGICR